MLSLNVNCYVPAFIPTFLRCFQILLHFLILVCLKVNHATHWIRCRMQKKRIACNSIKIYYMQRNVNMHVNETWNENMNRVGKKSKNKKQKKNNEKSWVCRIVYYNIIMCFLKAFHKCNSHSRWHIVEKQVFSLRSPSLVKKYKNRNSDIKPRIISNMNNGCQQLSSCENKIYQHNLCFTYFFVALPTQPQIVWELIYL